MLAYQSTRDRNFYEMSMQRQCFQYQLISNFHKFAAAGNTVEPHYLELVYLQLPAISNFNQFPMDLAILFIVFLLVYLELAYLKLPTISNKF